MDFNPSSSNDLCFVNVHERLDCYNGFSAPLPISPSRDKSLTFRKLIIKLQKEICAEDFRKVKFLFGGEIKKGRMEKILNLMDLVTVLKERCLLDEDSMTNLVDTFEIIERDDLVQLVRDYEAGCSSLTSTIIDSIEQNESTPAECPRVDTQQHVFITNEQGKVEDTSEQHFLQEENNTFPSTTLKSDDETPAILTMDQGTQTDVAFECDHLSPDLQNEDLLQLLCNESLLLSGGFELFDLRNKLSKLHMLRNEQGLKFLRSKLLRLYPQLLYSDIYNNC
ncbi:uncharacterized protein LOC132713533 [Ruditapes philippinarum]|uniref:uncharacterized protein LOC132713533 n=1 Tax=Ruditapes philippinarum TaxID=129788 RepID=UPI00295C06BF|nr:uncharacterized protein LOC132713533 [Ruditapes philippinarum]